MQRYNYMKLTDCKFVFDRIKTGQVKIYEGLDGQKILGAFEEWSNERLNTAEFMNYNRHLDYVSGEKSGRDKPFLIGNPDAPTAEKIEKYINTVSKIVNEK